MLTEPAMIELIADAMITLLRCRDSRQNSKPRKQKLDIVDEPSAC